MAQIKTKKLAGLCRRLGTGVHAGVDVRRLCSQEAQRAMGPDRRALESMVGDVSRGQSIADAMRNANGYFPPLTCELIEVGEQTGNLEKVLLELANHYDHQLQLRRQFISGIAFPMIQLIAAVFVIAGLICLLGMLADQAVLGFKGATGAIQFLAIIAFFFTMIGLAAVSVIKGWAGTAPIMIAMKIPYLGDCIRAFALSRLAWTLSMSLDAGVSASHSIRLALRSTQNPYYMSFIRAAEESIIEKGQEFNIALAQTGAFPSEFLDDLAAAEIAGTSAESLERMAKEYQQRAQSASKILTMIASFGIWAFVMILIVVVIFALALTLIAPIYKDAFEGLPESPF